MAFQTQPHGPIGGENHRYPFGGGLAAQHLHNPFVKNLDLSLVHVDPPLLNLD